MYPVFYTQPNRYLKNKFTFEYKHFQNMPENGVDQPVVASSPAMPAEIKTELDQQMAISLNGGVPPKVADAAAGVDAGNQQQQSTTITDPFCLFKEKFGYDTPETAIREIEELRAYRASPIIPELTFENEQSEKIMRALQAGKFQEVHSVLDQQMRIDRLLDGDMTTEKAADVVKHGMHIKYKDLTPQEIDYKFNKQFALPPKPVLLPAEDQEEFDARVAAWQSAVDDKKMELMIEAKLAKPELQSSKQKLVFPEIEQQVDPNYSQYLNALQEGEQGAAEAAIEYKKITPDSVEKKIRFIDEPNKIDFEFKYKPTPDKFAQAIQVTMDEANLWALFNNPDGTPNREKFLRVINYALDEEGVIMEAIKQGKNAALKSNLPDNSTGGLVRNLPPSQTQEPNELDKQMRIALKGYAGY
jgi:hypothetical protein